MKKILVPCDFSEPAIEAFKFAVDIASRSDASIRVLKVISLPLMAVYTPSIDMPAYHYDPMLLKELEANAIKVFTAMRKKFGKGLSDIHFLVVPGTISSCIQDYIREKKVDLVVMGTHGATGLREFFVGSNTEKIVRFSNVPVFAIRKAVPLKSIKDIVFPTTLDLGQANYIKKLKKLQEFFKARLHILYLNSPYSFIRESDLKEYAKHFKFTNVTINIRNNRYEPDGIVSFVEEIKADMLAMATHGRKGLSHFISGSVTEDVVNHIGCPVWTYVIKKRE
jgi:nucleotide-binding universal stress UspA family protein